jgi:phage/plasmid-like protein (TIGR03299 family)
MTLTNFDTNLGHGRTDITLMGMGGSAYATETYDGPVPMDRLRDLFAGRVHFSPLYTMTGAGVMTEVPNRHALVNEREEVLNVTSRRYGIHQFSDVLIDNLLTLTSASDGDVEVLGAGLVSNGAVGWVQVQTPTMRISGDEIAPTITLASSHNGTLLTSYRVGMFRFSCSNQIGALRRSGEGQRVYKLRHTMNSAVKFGEARHVLGLLFDEAETFADEVQRLIDTPVDGPQFSTMIRRLNPRPEGADVTPGAMTRWENRVDALHRLWSEDERVAPYRWTAWGAMQAFSTYQQWERPFRSTGSNGQATRAGRTMTDYLSGRLETAESNIADVVLAVAGRPV